MKGIVMDETRNLKGSFLGERTVNEATILLVVEKTVTEEETMFAGAPMPTLVDQVDSLFASVAGLQLRLGRLLSR